MAASANGHFVRHFLEMLAAMFVGMAVLGAGVAGILASIGRTDLLDFAALRAFLMAGYMTVGMTLIMRYRGHAWPRVWEMAAAMSCRPRCLSGRSGAASSAPADCSPAGTS